MGAELGQANLDYQSIILAASFIGLAELAVHDVPEKKNTHQSNAPLSLCIIKMTETS